MEVFLNLVWVLLAAAGFSLWWRFERRRGAERFLPLIALVMLLVILFPVISVTDDLWAAQNPAETDTCLRRDQISAPQYSMPPSWFALQSPAVGAPEVQKASFPEIAQFVPTPSSVPTLPAIAKRPPPAA